MSNLKEAVTRREMLKLFGRFGVTSTLLAAGGLTAGSFTLPELAKAAEETQNERYATKPKYQMRYGAAGYDAERLKLVQVGSLDFIRDLEARSNGAIRVEFIGNNQVCNELDCVRNMQDGIIEIFTSATQNAAGAAPYYNVLDFPFLFPTRASFYNFLYHPKSEALLREPLRRMHKSMFLFTMFEHRGLMLGPRYQDRDLVTSIDQLQGAQIRVTGSQLIRIGLDLMGVNAVPLAWEETMDGLNQGLIDGMETWSTAVAAFNMTPVVSQAVELRFTAGLEHCAMSTDVFDNLEPELQNAVLESAYFTQSRVQAGHEATIYNSVGVTEPPLPGSVFDEAGVRVSMVSEAEVEKAKQMSAPSYVPEPWEQWRERLNGWANGQDVYSEIHAIANELPLDTQAQNVAPRRWW